MKRRKLLQHLGVHRCTILCEGAGHTIVINLDNGQQSQVPRHREIKANMIRAICKQLDIPIPRER
jgi:hypothetical protein